MSSVLSDGAESILTSNKNGSEYPLELFATAFILIVVLILLVKCPSKSTEAEFYFSLEHSSS